MKKWDNIDGDNIDSDNIDSDNIDNSDIDNIDDTSIFPAVSWKIIDQIARIYSVNRHTMNLLDSREVNNVEWLSKQAYSRLERTFDTNRAVKGL
jgi:hypothetical protein